MYLQLELTHFWNGPIWSGMGEAVKGYIWVQVDPLTVCGQGDKCQKRSSCRSNMAEYLKKHIPTEIQH